MWSTCRSSASQSGLGDRLGGIALSVSNAFLFTTPLIQRLIRRFSVRRVIRTAFAAVGTLMILGSLLAFVPWAAVVVLFFSTAFLITLDVCGGLPFLMAVKPSERTEMAAVYSSFRDVSGIVTPGVAALVLLVAPVAGVFTATGVLLWLAWAIAGSLHPRLGHARPGPATTPAPAQSAPRRSPAVHPPAA